MRPHFKIVIVAETASELLSKSRELAGELQSGTPLVEEMSGTETVAPKQHSTEAVHQAPPVVGNLPPMVSAPAAGSTSEKEVDAVGMAWDARIHQDPKKKKADGTWMNLRGLDKNIKAQVEAELRGGSLPVGGGSAKAMPPFGSMTQQQYQTHIAPPAAMPPAAPAAPAPMGLNAGHTVDTFKKNLPLILMELANEGKLTEAYAGQLKGWLQVNELVDVVKDSTKAEQLFNLFVQYKLIQAA